MTKIYLIRHAETKPTEHDATRWPLSERGEQQAAALATQAFWNEVVAIVSSDEPKAVATAQDIAVERGIPLLTRACLRELKRTSEWLDDYDERVREVFDKPAMSIGGWERAADAQARILACVDELIARFDPKPYAVVSHGMVLALLLASAQNLVGHTYEIWQQLGYASVVCMER